MGINDMPTGFAKQQKREKESGKLNELIRRFNSECEDFRDLKAKDRTHDAMDCLYSIINSSLPNIQIYLGDFKYDDVFVMDNGSKLSKDTILNILIDEINKLKAQVKEPSFLFQLEKGCKDNAMLGIADYIYRIDENWFYEMLDKEPFKMTKSREVKNLNSVQERMLADEKFVETREAVTEVEDFAKNKQRKLASLPDNVFENSHLVESIINIISNRIYNHFEKELKSTNSEQIKRAIDLKIKKAVEEINLRHNNLKTKNLDNALQLVKDYEI